MKLKIWARSASFLRGIGRPLRKFIEIGTDGKDTPANRRVRLLNAFTIFVLCFTLLSLLQYMTLGWKDHPILITLTATTWILWSLTPVLHRFGEAYPVAYVGLVATAAFATQGYITGSSLGSHYFLLAAPAAVLFLGSKRVLLSFGLMTTLLIGFYIVEFEFPRQSFEPVPPAFAARKLKISLFGSSVLLFWAIYYALRIADVAEAALEREYERSEHLLLNLMPSSIAARLKEKPEDIIADQYDDVAILFADIVDFTPRAGHWPAPELVRFLNRIFSAFDQLAAKHGLEKIKTVGDAYMVAGGMPVRREGHAYDVGSLALDMLATMNEISAEWDEPVQIRIGIHCGPAIAGVIGTRRLFYDVWGDTVNTASRMESYGSAGMIRVTEKAKAALGERFKFRERGEVNIKGKGIMRLYYLTGRRD